ncbi:methyltransferase domain-containing protein [Hyphomicrobium sp. xq]|uniref:Methyltransferase domain-containing protein n=1 Tax=Hyphomicrobium album TaxID=2665159 RepID=A0A6I3KLZ1_9HYPH|nr:class I SAM-dependent methyltransferase [Hyphomicrobium album]MTD95388.1 methyltransferase domain-containing protein [Hyphomicrobium album]
MDSRDIRRHWTNWATTYGSALRATTKTWTAKALEIDALSRRLRSVVGDSGGGKILEMGCGNGINCVELAKFFPNLSFDGVDFVPEMVTAAIENARSADVEDRVRFFVGDAIGAGNLPELQPSYDVVFTDRCLINLDAIELQKQAISILASKVKPGGYLLMIENSLTSYAKQNRCREALGLAARKPADFNLFFDEDEILLHVTAAGLELVDVEDFSSLHDLMLYVLVPAINGGAVDYDHPLVQAATTLSRELAAEATGTFGSYGQNRLFVCRRLT